MRLQTQILAFFVLMVLIVPPGDSLSVTPASQQATSSVAVAEPSPVSLDSGPESEKALNCLALNIYHEARSEPLKGQLAVAAVTLNRVASESFPDSVCRVVTQGGERRNRCQFSWWCDGKGDDPTETTAWKQALEVSRRSMTGLGIDPTDGALYYHADYVEPRWARTFKKTAKIGRHLFYRPTSS